MADAIEATFPDSKFALSGLAFVLDETVNFTNLKGNEFIDVSLRLLATAATEHHADGKATRRQLETLNYLQSVNNAKQDNGNATRLNSKLVTIPILDESRLLLPTAIFPQDLGSFWALKKPKNHATLIALLLFYKQTKASLLPTRHPNSDDELSFEDVVSTYPENALEVLAINLGINYYKLGKLVDRHNRLDALLATRPVKREGSDSTKRSHKHRASDPILVPSISDDATCNSKGEPLVIIHGRTYAITKNFELIPEDIEDCPPPISTPAFSDWKLGDGSNLTGTSIVTGEKTESDKGSG